MAHELYTRTNQKLYFAWLALETWRKAEETRSMNGQARIQAEREAVLFHLYGALLGLCHEIAGYYRLTLADSARVEAVLNCAVLEAAPNPELAELVELAGSPASWLTRLLEAYNALFRPPRPAKPSQATATTEDRESLIQAVALEDTESPLGHEQLEAWRQALKALVLRYREALSEC